MESGSLPKQVLFLLFKKKNMSAHHVFRLTQGTDLKKALVAYVNEHQLSACIVSCCVGCLSQLHIRLAGAQSVLHLIEPLEIVSLTGTLCTTGAHIHISVAKIDGQVVGGHLLDGMCGIAKLFTAQGTLLAPQLKLF